MAKILIALALILGLYAPIELTRVIFYYVSKWPDALYLMFGVRNYEIEVVVIWLSYLALCLAVFNLVDG